MPNGPLLTTREAAARRGVSRSTIHRAVNDGTLVPAQTFEMGSHGAYLFTVESIDALSDDAQPVAS